MDRETAEALRAECERLMHRQMAMESDFARVDELKEKVKALAWENDKLKDDAISMRAHVNRYKGLAAALQRGELVWARNPGADAKNEADRMRALLDSLGFEGTQRQDIAAEYGTPTRIDVKVG